MSSLASFVRLDFITVKPYFPAKNLLIYAAVALFLTVMSGNAFFGIGAGTLIATVLISYPFAIGEKNNLDALYATLSLSRREVVAGRYLFVLAFNLCAVMGAMILGILGMTVARAVGMDVSPGNPLWVFVAFGAALLVQSVLLPTYFKFGYTKAKFISIIPFAVIMAAFFAFAFITRTHSFFADTSWFIELLADNAILIVGLATVAVALIVLASYRLSQSFYSRREF